MQILLNRIANPLVKFILCTFLHHVMSRSVMLITVTGRRSGRRYTTPVNYVRDGDMVTAISKRHRMWWRNLRGGAPVMLRIKGKTVHGFGALIKADDEVIATELQSFYGNVSPIEISREKAMQLARNSVIVRIRLGADRQSFPGRFAEQSFCCSEGIYYPGPISRMPLLRLCYLDSQVPGYVGVLNLGVLQTGNGDRR